jgi:serine/threonine-protein kinase RsbW
MKIKLAVITKDKDIANSALKSTNKDIAEIVFFKNEPTPEQLMKYKFDVVIFDKKINEKWLTAFENIKHINIKTIFIVIVDTLAIDEIKTGFKKGVYEILKRHVEHKDLIKAFANAVNTAAILKSNEKIHKYCKHYLNFILPTDVDLVNETVLQIIETAKLTGFIKDKEIESNLRLAYTEAIINAMIHGNKSVFEKKVVINGEITNKLIKIVISDEGKGYDISSIDNPLDNENLLKSSGRGLYLIKAITDEVILKNNGSQIILINRKE